MQYFYRTTKNLTLTLLVAILIPITLKAQEVFPIDSVDNASLIEASRLQTLRDKSIIIAPNPYYSSTLPITLPIRLVNKAVSTNPPYISFKDDKQPLLFWGSKKPTYQLTPVAINGFIRGLTIDEYTLMRVQMENPDLLRNTQSELFAHKLDNSTIDANVPILDNINVEITKQPEDLFGKELKRRYWKFGLESILQFSQNYISKNWHQGGGSNMNLYNRQFLRYDYSRDRISWNNELEWKLSVYTSAADTVSKYRVAEDLLRFRSNFGIQAWGKLFYSLDAEVKTSLFTRREENKTDILSALFSPVIVNVGLGVKYILDKKFSSYYGRRLRVMASISPFAYDFRYSYKTTGIDLKRHGFAEGKNMYSAFGSIIRIESIFDYSQTISWQSRFLYNTSYKRIETEWENSINFALTQYFSTRINVIMRFDDAVPITPENPNPLQINEIFSLGFSYQI